MALQKEILLICFGKCCVFCHLVNQLIDHTPFKIQAEIVLMRFDFSWLCSQHSWLPLAMRRTGQSGCTHCVRHILCVSAVSATTYRTPKRIGWALTLRARIATVDWPNPLNWKIVDYGNICNKWTSTVASNGSVADSIGANTTGSGDTTET